MSSPRTVLRARNGVKVQTDAQSVFARPAEEAEDVPA